MPKKNKLFSFMISSENKKNLVEFSKLYKLSMGQILNSIIANASSKNSSKLVDNFDENQKRIKVITHLNSYEYNALKKLAETEFLSVPKYLKFLISTKLYEQKIPSNLELILLSEIRAQLIRIIVNLKIISHKFKVKNNHDKELKILLENVIKNISQDISDLTKSISNFSKINYHRFG